MLYQKKGGLTENNKIMICSVIKKVYMDFVVRRMEKKKRFSLNMVIRIQYIIETRKILLKNMNCETVARSVILFFVYSSNANNAVNHPIETNLL